ncbi:hypothetical protein [Halarchaeum sp. CBA1220]|nr:hypothetical protein [Halarchaeum sp. CBA1220]
MRIRADEDRSRVFGPGYTTASDGAGYDPAIIADIVATHDS